MCDPLRPRCQPTKTDLLGMFEGICPKYEIRVPMEVPLHCEQSDEGAHTYAGLGTEVQVDEGMEEAAVVFQDTEIVSQVEDVDLELSNVPEPPVVDVKAGFVRADAPFSPQGPDWIHQRLHLRFKSDIVVPVPPTTAPPPPPPPPAAAQHEDERQNPDQGEPTGDPPSSTAVAHAIKDLLLPDVAQILRFQHRTCVYTLFVDHATFRVLRWDRTAVLLTEPVDYLESVAGTRELLEFLYAFARLDDAAQGLDPSATLLDEASCGWRRMDFLARAHPGDTDSYESEHVIPDPTSDLTPSSTAIRQAGDNVMHCDPTTPCREACSGHDMHVVETFQHVRESFAQSLVAGWPRYRLMVDGRVFLVCWPINGEDEDPDQNKASNAVFGRGTRGYVALDWEKQTFVFLKDAWRILLDGVEQEGAVLGKLNAAGVAHVPTLVAHEDIPGRYQQVLSWQYAPPDMQQRMHRQVHYRIAVEEVCFPLDRFRSGKQLVRFVKDCVKGTCLACYSACGCAMRETLTAYHKGRYFHGDVSDGNLMIYPTARTRDGKRRVKWKGMLTDWEFACPVTNDRVGLPTHTMVSPGFSLVLEATNSLTSVVLIEQGTRIFLSYSRQLSHGRPIYTADELESFILVLLYNALWWIRHSHTPQTARVVKALFEHHPGGEDDGLAGRAKKFGKSRRPEFDGEQVVFLFQEGDDHDIREHPLNKVVSDMLAIIGSRYEVLQWRQATREKEKKGEQLDREHGPTKGVEYLAKRSYEHSNVRGLLGAAIKESQWPENDRVELWVDSEVSESVERDREGTMEEGAADGATADEELGSVGSADENEQGEDQGYLGDTEEGYGGESSSDSIPWRGELKRALENEDETQRVVKRRCA
ncbi:hypothetical protein C8Q80DRAFT_1201375 [Daedaleopsis nitida]|nr:hypothetical protein C8Q80DRAFT_1201375 [Daedaleopsis nitida]